MLGTVKHASTYTGIRSLNGFGVDYRAFGTLVRLKQMGKTKLTSGLLLVSFYFTSVSQFCSSTRFSKQVK